MTPKGLIMCRNITLSTWMMRRNLSVVTEYAGTLHEAEKGNFI